MDEIKGRERITRSDISAYKREILDQSVLVTPQAAAEILSVTPRTVHNYIREGKLNAYSGSGLNCKGVRILAAELREYVRSIKVSRDARDL